MNYDDDRNRKIGELVTTSPEELAQIVHNLKSAGVDVLVADHVLPPAPPTAPRVEVRRGR